MNKPRLIAAMGYIDDDLVSGAVGYRPAHSKIKTVWFRNAIVAASMCFIIIAVPVFTHFFEHEAEDPHWHETHFETAELSEIETICGTDLLLNKIPISNQYQSQYIFEITENGSFENSADWVTLSTTINYGDSILDSNADNVFCLISFNGSDGEFNTELLDGAIITEFNGYTVNQKEISTADATAKGITLGNKLGYHGWAQFVHNGYTYYIATDSDNPDFFEMTLEQMLN